MSTNNESNSQAWQLLFQTLKQASLHIVGQSKRDGYAIGTPASEIVIRTSERWKHLADLVEIMENFPSLQRFYPSAHNGILRLSRAPFHMVNELQYNYWDAEPLWVKVSAPSEFLVCEARYLGDGCFVLTTAMTGNAVQAAAYVARHLEAHQY